MRKLKSEFKKNEQLTKQMENYFKDYCGCGQDKNYKFYGVYEYKNYQIFFDNEPFSKIQRRHISISEKKYREIKKEDLEFIANHFIGENYTIQYSLFGYSVQIFEEF